VAEQGRQARHHLEIVGQDRGTCRQDGLQVGAEVVGDEHLDQRRRGEAAEGADRGRVVRGAAVRQVVASDRGQHHVAQAELGGGPGHGLGLGGIRGRGCSGAVHRAEGAAARAGVPEQEEGGRPRSPALRPVGAARLLADRVQPPADQGPVDRAAGPCQGHLQPRGLAATRALRLGHACLLGVYVVV